MSIQRWQKDTLKKSHKQRPKFTTEGAVDMEQTFYVGMKICDYYAVHINGNGYEQKEMV